MSDIYEQHRNAFTNVSAAVVLHNGESVATIAFKFPRDGAGRLYVYIHWFGHPMVRGYASGFGYDKKSAACANAARKIKDDIAERDPGPRAAFLDAMWKDDGHSWDWHLEAAGFTVIRAV